MEKTVSDRIFKNKKHYYFITYHETNSENKKYFQNSVIDMHPLKWQMKKHFTNCGLGTTFLINLLFYDEISKSEFEEFNSWQKEL